jgi:aminoglycoside 3-N-acetyltransferase
MERETHVVTRAALTEHIAALELSGKPVCLHASLKSFGVVEGGADTIIDAFLDADCTLMVPTFTGIQLEVYPEPNQMIERNGWNVAEAESWPPRTDVVFSPELDIVDARMGSIPSAMLRRPERVRGNHPHNSFTAVGPKAQRLLAEQAWDDVYAPLRELTKQHGNVVLAGVGLNRLTILHFAETLAGRRLFRRWATGDDGHPAAVQVGSCSEGFPNLEGALGMLTTEQMVGHSLWRVFPAAETVTTSAAIIRNEPEITHCGDPECVRCSHAVAGGPRI